MKKMILVDDIPEAPKLKLELQLADCYMNYVPKRMIDTAAEAIGSKFRDRPARKCLLPGCGNLTNHRGGYCCAEHCREHK